MSAEPVTLLLNAMEALLEEDLKDLAAWPVLLRRLDAPALEHQARQRAERQEQLRALQERLLPALEPLQPRPPAVAQQLARLRGHAQHIKDMDARHEAMARLGLGTLRGYLGSLSPTAGAYTRTGQPAAGRARAALSRHA